MINFKQYFFESSRKNWDDESKQAIQRHLKFTPPRIEELETKSKTETDENKKKLIQDEIELNNLAVEYAKKGIYIDPVIYSSGHIRPNMIYIPKKLRNQGIGTEVLNRIIQLADKQNRVILVNPDTHLGGSSVSRLIKFYKRFGFVENSGRNKDFRLSERMYRLPKSTVK